jgi:hypothetical protein
MPYTAIHDLAFTFRFCVHLRQVTVILHVVDEAITSVASAVAMAAGRVQNVRSCRATVTIQRVGEAMAIVSTGDAFVLLGFRDQTVLKVSLFGIVYQVASFVVTSFLSLLRNAVRIILKHEFDIQQ